VIITTPTTVQAYSNARNHWVKNCRKSYQDIPIGRGEDIYYELVVTPFHEWLKSQGCRITRCHSEHEMFGVDSYNVAVGFDVMEFDSEQHQITFLLRWA
jgi:uncharacterized protein YkwD